MTTLSRDDYFKVGLQLLADAGIGAVTIANVCARLNVSKGSFYHHFKSAQDLQEKMLGYWEDIYGRARLERLEGLDSRARLEALIGVVARAGSRRRERRPRVGPHRSRCCGGPTPPRRAPRRGHRGHPAVVRGEPRPGDGSWPG